MQDAIIMYENGHPVGGEGHPTDADDITFNNTGTDLVSENVEDAIVEVNERTKHGIVELWKNSDITSNFAGQTIQIQNFDSTKIDALIIAFEESKDEAYGAQWREFDKDVLNTPSTLRRLTYLNVANTSVSFYARTVTFTLSGTTLSVGFSDATIYTYPFSGSGQSSSTNNGVDIPVRILGIIHND